MKFTEPTYRPPQEAGSLLLRGTQGCTYNDCHFCYICRDSLFGAASLEQVEAELLSQKPYFRKDTPVYIVGANSFTLPFEKLKSIAQLIKKHIPLCPEISLHTRIPDITRKSDAELRELSALGITHLYPGTENGNEAALKLMNKGHTAVESLEQMQRLDEAGIAYTVNYIIGMAGHGQGALSARKTAELFNQVHPRRIITTGLTAFTKAPLFQMVKSGELVEASELEKIEEELIFLENLTVNTVFDTRHYLNLLHIIARIPDEKAKAMQRLSEFLQNHTDESITEFYQREKLASL